jgi:hypothetical protein
MTKRAGKFKKFDDPAVAAIFAGYPADLRRQLLVLRELIFETAAATEGVGKLEETLRWGEPSYLTTQSGSGSMVRINARGSQDQYAMYFHCQTDSSRRSRTGIPKNSPSRRTAPSSLPTAIPSRSTNCGTASRSRSPIIGTEEPAKPGSRRGK